MQNATARAERIMSALSQYECGVPIYTILLKWGITEDTLFTWHRHHQNMNLGQLQRVCLIEDENAALQRLVNSLAQDDDRQVDVEILGSTPRAMLSA
jgi:putative transposase